MYVCNVTNPRPEASLTPYQLIINLFSMQPMYHANHLERFVNFMSADSVCQPTCWRMEEAPAKWMPIDADKIFDACEGESTFGQFIRKRVPKYQGLWSFSPNGIQSVYIEFKPFATKHAKAVFEWVESAVHVFKPICCMVHASNHRSMEDPYERCQQNIPAFFKCGPAALSARTYLCQELVDLIGPNHLRSAVASLVKQRWGGVRVDLVDAPWDATTEVLRRRQSEAMTILQPTGVFADYSNYILPKAGPKWTKPDTSQLPPGKYEVIEFTDYVEGPDGEEIPITTYHEVEREDFKPQNRSKKKKNGIQNN